MNSSIIDEIQQDGSKYFADIKDRLFINMCAAAAGAITGHALDKSSTEVLSRKHFNQMANVLTNERLRMVKVLATDTDVRIAGNWEATDVGDAFATETTKNGMTGDVLEGFSLIKTIKTDILPVSTLYGFASPDYLGFNEYLVGERPKLEIEMRFGKIYWRVVGTTGMYIANAKGLVELQVKDTYV